MTSESELSDKEWRQMRRQMPKLHFEPVPETPALLPRSLYGEIDDKELESIREEEEEKAEESAGLRRDLPSLVEVDKKDRSELPSTSMAVSPLITRRFQPREQKRPPENDYHLDDAELAAIDAEMAAAHDATRRTVMRAFIDLKAKNARTEALERMKLSAAHSNDIKILQQDKLEELKAQMATAEAKCEKSDLVLDRFSMFSAKQSHLNQERWSGGYSLAACFRAWKKTIRQKIGKNDTLRRVLLQYCKRQQRDSFRHWNTSARNHLLQTQLQDQKDWYEHRIVEMAKEYQLKIHQLQHEVDDAKCQVTDAQKCCQKLEEDLRLIFLRGVSAMNIEALTAFRSSHKHRHTLGEQERSDLPTRHKEKSSNQVAASVKTVNIAIPEVMPPPKEVPTNMTPETSVPAPVVAVEAVDESSSLSPSKRSKAQASYSQAPPTVDRATSGWSRLNNTTELRSAEMIRKHELPATIGRQSADRLISSSYRPYSAPSPTKKWSRPQLNAKYQVEMQYMRSEVAAAAARSTRTRATPHRNMRRQHGTEPEIDREMHEDDNEGILNDTEEDGIDLEGYEEYLEHLKSKGAMRPCSARVVRPLPTECPQFFADNPVPTRPARPASARPRMRTTPRNSSDNRTLNGSQSRSNGVGMRRKRQGEKLVHARIRAVYNDVGHSSVAVKHLATPHGATPALSKFKGLKESDMHDEYYRLLDAESELKAACLQEQQKCMKAVTHVRRLEEIIAMKDKKIESLLHAKAVGADRSLSVDRGVVQRERAERDRQSHALTQKLKQKIAQQSQFLCSYEEAMQSLRSGIKSTSLMELEEERSQLYKELRHHQELLNRQRLEWEVHQQKLIAFAEVDARNKHQIAKLQQENKIISHEKRKLEQEVGFLKSRVGQLQGNLTLEQRKRTYDRDFSESVGKRAASSPTQKVMLAQALDEMKRLVRRETVTSIKREKLKSPETTSFQPDPVSPADRPASATKIPGGTTPSRSRAQSATTTSTRPQIPVARKTTTIPLNTGPHLEMYDAKLNSKTSKIQNQETNDDHDETKGAQKTTEADRVPSNMETALISTTVCQDSHQSESARPSENINSSVTGNSEQDASEELSEVYYQLCTVPKNSLQLTASTLELANGEALDSASSADLLDDAQHLKSELGMNTTDSIDDIADTELLNFDLSKNEEVRDTEAPFSLPPVASGVDSSEALDDLYAPDFLDTDAQLSLEGSEDFTHM